MSLTTSANSSDDFQRLSCSFKIQARGGAWDEYQTRGPDRSSESMLTCSRVDDDTVVFCSYMIQFTKPIGDVLIGKRNFIDREFQGTGLGPLECGSLRIRIN